MFNSDDPLHYLVVHEPKYLGMLDREYKNADEGPDRYKQLHSLSDPTRVRIATDVHISAADRRAQLVYAGASHEGPEEYVVNVQGYVMRCKLPPTMDKSRLGDNPRQMSQSITLGGLGAAAFEKSVQGMLEVYSHISRHVPQGQLQAWEPQMTEGNLSATFSNRYFASANEARGQESLALGDFVDPLNILRAAVPHGIHTADNKVLYYERIVLDSGKTTHRAISPTGIARGYLVEVQAGFCAVPVGRDKYRFLTKLRSICVLNRQVDADKNKACIEKLKLSVAGPSNPLKRRVGYDSDEDSPDPASKRTKSRDNSSDVDVTMQKMGI